MNKKNTAEFDSGLIHPLEALFFSLMMSFEAAGRVLLNVGKNPAKIEEVGLLVFWDVRASGLVTNAMVISRVSDTSYRPQK